MIEEHEALSQQQKQILTSLLEQSISIIESYEQAPDKRKGLISGLGSFVYERINEAQSSNIKEIEADLTSVNNHVIEETGCSVPYSLANGSIHRPGRTQSYYWLGRAFLAAWVACVLYLAFEAAIGAIIIPGRVGIALHGISAWLFLLAILLISFSVWNPNNGRIERSQLSWLAKMLAYILFFIAVGVEQFRQ